MAIPLAGQFDYEVVLGRISSKGWGGRAAPAAHDSHPGLAGDRPQLELAGGVVTLRCTESVSALAKSHYRFWGPPAASVSFRAGEALEAVAADGDVIRVSRGATTDLAVTLFRRDEVLMGLGAVGRRLGPLTIEEDPRAREVDLYHLPSTLEQPDTTLAWLDCSDPQLDATVESLAHLNGQRLVIAIAGPDPGQRRALNHRIAGSRLSLAHASREFVDVDSRFTTREQWLEYLRRLPKTRPRDLYIRFGFDDERHVDVREDELAFHRPWHLFVAKVYTPGIPGEWTQLGIARENRALTPADIVDAAKLIASGRLNIVR